MEYLRTAVVNLIISGYKPDGTVPRGMLLACVINCKPINNHRVAKTLKKPQVVDNILFKVLGIIYGCTFS